MRQDEHPLIYFRESAAGRRPALLGSRLDVAAVLTTLRQNENSVDETADYLEIPIEHVEHPDDGALHNRCVTCRNGRLPHRPHRIPSHP